MADFEALPSPLARFRYLVVSAVLVLVLQGWRRSDAVREAAGRSHLEGTVLRRVSERTLWRWLSAYERAGWAGLEPRARSRTADSTVLPERLLVYLRSERKADPRASIPELIRRARLAGVLHPKAPVDRSTVWRAMQRLGLSTRRRRPPQGDDTRRFAYPERMQLVMVDFKHFRAGPDRRRRVAIYFLDDATRYGLGVLVATSERPDVVLPALAALLRQYGRMDALYWDHGAGFVADDVVLVCVRLEVPAFFGAVAYPEGHGKIERFNRSAKARLLRALDGAAAVDPDCGALTLRLQHDLVHVYNHLPHESLDLATPYERWTASGRALRPIDSEAWLDGRFTLPLLRTVSADHVIRYEGTLYEVPRACQPGRHTFFRRLLGDEAPYLLEDGRLVRLHPLDPAFNATAGRARRTESEERDAPPAKTASMLAFERAYPSLVGTDGGFTDPPKEEDDHEQ